MRRACAAALLLALAAAGCDSGGEEAATPSTAATPTTTVKIVSDLPLQGSAQDQTESIVDAIELYLDQVDIARAISR